MNDCFKPYVCPYSYKEKNNQILLCKKLMKDGINYAKLDNATNALCGEQFYCPILKENINTKEAEQCYNRYLAAEKENK